MMYNLVTKMITNAQIRLIKYGKQNHMSYSKVAKLAKNKNTVEPRLAATPEARTSTVMRTLCAVPNVSTTTPEIRAPRYSGHSEKVPRVSALEGSNSG